MWILEEILSSLIKLPHGKRVSKGYRYVRASAMTLGVFFLFFFFSFRSGLLLTEGLDLVHYRLRDGSKIHASSALLLQLIHTCAERPVIDPVSPDLPELERPAQKIEMQKV